MVQKHTAHISLDVLHVEMHVEILLGGNKQKSAR